MSQLDVLNLVKELSNGQADPALAANFYIEAIDDLGEEGWLTTAGLAGYAENGTELAITSSMRKLFGVIYADRQLSKMTLRQLEHVDYRWRERRGSPRGFTIETETAKTIALYPTPDVNAGLWNGMFPPLGIGYPPFEGLILYSEYRDPIPQHWELILVFKILAREYARESDHVDPNWVKFATQMAEMLMQMFS